MSFYKKYLRIPLIVILSITLNVSGSHLAGLFAFPLYMDSVATVGCAALCGLWPSVIVAVMTNFLLSQFSSTALLFMLCHINMAIFASLIFSRAKRKNNGSLTIEAFLWVSLVTGFSNTALGSTFSVLLFYGNTSIPQIDNAVQGVFTATGSMIFATYWGGIVTNIIDKIIASLCGFGVFFLIEPNKIIFNDFSVNRKITRRIFKIEYILIFLSVVNLLATLGFKKQTEIKTKNCYLQLLKVLEFESHDFYGEDFQQLEDSLFCYSYYNPEFKQKLSELKNISASIPDSSKIKLYSELQFMIYADHSRLLFGFDSLVGSSFFLIFLILFVLTLKTENLRRSIMQNEITAAEQKKLSRNLHDSALQNLAVLQLQIQNKNKEASLSLVRSIIQDLRYLCGSLKMNNNLDLVNFVKNLTDLFSVAYGINCNFYNASKNALDFNASKKSELEYIIRELLSNAARHSKADRIVVKMLDVGSKFILTVEDNGTGFDKSKILPEKARHFGINNIEERVSKLGGTVQWNPGKKSGTVVSIKIE